jgi:hypothetical protein
MFPFAVNWDVIVSIATCYGLDGLGTNPGGGEIFCTHSDRPCGPPSLLYNGYQVFPRSKAARVWHWPPTPSSAEVKQRVKLYLYFPAGSSWPVLGRTLSLLFVSSCQQYIAYSFLEYKETNAIARSAKVQKTPHKFTESVHIPEVREGKPSNLGTMLLKCLSGVPDYQVLD